METNLIPSILFIALGLFTAGFFYIASGRVKIPLIILLTWTGLHCILAARGFYLVTDRFPPRLTLVLVPAIIVIISLLTLKKGRTFVSRFDLKWLTLLHVVRLPVEIGLFLLYKDQLIPGLMTFEGWNFDILAGITAPFIYYFAFVRRSLTLKSVLWWNLACLALLLNILVLAVLSLPTPFQQLAFDQPNVGVLYFPYILLPALIVPVVLFALLVAITRLWRSR